MDMLPWTALIKYCHQTHQHATEVTPLIGVKGPPLDITAIPDVLTVVTRIGTGLVVPDPTHITMDIGVAATMTPVGATPGHSTDLPNIATHATEAQVHTTTAVTHHTTDLHPIEIFLEMTADLEHTNAKNNISNQHKDLATRSYGDRAFSVHASKLSNKLPSELKNINETNKFKRKLKTHLYKMAYG